MDNSALIILIITFLSIWIYYLYYGLNEVRRINVYNNIFYDFNDPVVYVFFILLGLSLLGVGGKYWRDYMDKIYKNLYEEEPKKNNEATESLYNISIGCPLFIILLLLLPIGNLIAKYKDFFDVYFNRDFTVNPVTCKKTLKSKDIKNSAYGTLVVVGFSILSIFVVIAYNIYLTIRNYTLTNENLIDEELLRNESINTSNKVMSGLLVLSFLVISVFWVYWGCRTLRKDKSWVNNCDKNAEILSEDRWNMLILLCVFSSLFLSIGISV